MLAAAPKEMTAAGYADLAAKIPRRAEWMIADLFGTEPDSFPLRGNVFMNDLDAMLADPEGCGGRQTRSDRFALSPV